MITLPFTLLSLYVLLRLTLLLDLVDETASPNVGFLALHRVDTTIPKLIEEVRLTLVLINRVTNLGDQNENGVGESIGRNAVRSRNKRSRFRTR